MYRYPKYRFGNPRTSFGLYGQLNIPESRGSVEGKKPGKTLAKYTPYRE